MRLVYSCMATTGTQQALPVFQACEAVRPGQWGAPLPDHVGAGPSDAYSPLLAALGPCALGKGRVLGRRQTPGPLSSSGCDCHRLVPKPGVVGGSRERFRVRP